MIIYVVEGQTGEYSDHREWPVKAFVSEKKAKEFVLKVSEEYRRIRQKYDRYCNDRFWYHNWDREKDQNLLDPYMEADYTGTTYSYYFIELDKEE